MSKIYYIYSEDNKLFIEENRALEVWTSEISLSSFFLK